jgi:hypothetical protein
MSREVTKMKRKHELILHLKARAAAGLSQDRDEQKLRDAETTDSNGFVKTFKPICLDGASKLWRIR